MRRCCRVSPWLAHNPTQYLPMAATWFSRLAIAMARTSYGWRLWTGARRLLQIPNADGNWPLFGPKGEIYFRRMDGFAYRFDRTEEDAGKSSISQSQEIMGVSPDGQWIAVFSFDPSKKGEDGKQAADLVYPTGGGSPVRIWGTDSRF